MSKCPNEECEAYGACGHHGPGGTCLALEVADETIDINRCIGSVHVWLSRVDEKSNVRCQCGEYTARDWCSPDVSRVQFRQAVDEDAPTQPVIITDPPEMPKRYAGCCMCNESTEFYDAAEWNERCPVHGREARDAAKKMRAHDLEVAAALDQLLQGSTTLPAWGRRAITLAIEKLRR